MKLIVKDNEEEIKLDGIIKRVSNKFFVELEVPMSVKLNSIIRHIKGYYSSIGNITLVNNRNLSIRGSSDDPEYSIYEYEVGYIISSHIDEDTLLINSMQLYFKEFDYFFVENRYRLDIENMDKQLTITQEFKTEKLFENDSLYIEYIKTAGLDKDEFGHILFLNPSKVEIVFKEPLKLPQIFEEITKIESCFGFVIAKKMNLIEIGVGDTEGIYHEIIAPFQKKYEEVLLSEFHIVDINSKELLKDILNNYYCNQRIAAAINMSYEYIYNDLDNILEFTSLVNTLELVLTDKNFAEDLKTYVINNNIQLKNNNERILEIFESLTKEQCKFIKSFYKFENVELRDKFRYIFYIIFELKESENSEKYISKIITTRNYYVHGGKKDNTLNNVDMLCTKYLLRDILYVLITEICSNNTNSLIESYKLTIPTVYENLVKFIEKDEENGM